MCTICMTDVGFSTIYLKTRLGKLGRPQHGLLTALLEYFTVLLEYLNLFQSQ